MSRIATTRTPKNVETKDKTQPVLKQNKPPHVLCAPMHVPKLLKVGEEQR
jgi:hypothetical protein